MANEFPTRTEIVSSQLAQLRSLLRSLVPANRFYTKKFAKAGLGQEVDHLADFARHFLVTVKEELVEDQQAFPPFGSNLTFPIERYTRFHQTSGTAGTPLRWLDTPESWDWMVRSWMEVLQAADIGQADRIYFAFSFGPFIGFWLAYEAAERLGALCIPGGGLSSASRVGAILDNGVTVLCCTPTYGIRLAEAAEEHHLALSSSRVKTLIVAGEPGGSIPATRARLETLWRGARVFDHHGMTEVGPVTHQCPACPGVLHVIESAYLAEVLDPVTGEASAPGRAGELVLTTLGRIGSPVIRYRTGDLVKPVLGSATVAAAPCACGRHTMALEGGILGRVDDMVIVRGVNVYPSAVEEIIRGRVEVEEYRVTIDTSGSLTELSIEIEPAPGSVDPSELMKQIEIALQGALSLRIAVTAVPAGSLPRFEMKAKRWIRA